MIMIMIIRIMIITIITIMVMNMIIIMLFNNDNKSGLIALETKYRFTKALYR